ARRVAEGDGVWPGGEDQRHRDVAGCAERPGRCDRYLPGGTAVDGDLHLAAGRGSVGVGDDNLVGAGSGNGHVRDRQARSGTEISGPVAARAGVTRDHPGPPGQCVTRRFGLVGGARGRLGEPVVAAAEYPYRDVVDPEPLYHGELLVEG